jgi:hypothetical protein
MNATAESDFIEAFVVPDKRERYVSFLNSPKRRPKFLRELYHFRDFDPACLVSVAGPSDSAEGLISELRRRGAPVECRVISVQADLDGAIRPLAEVIRAVFALVEGTIVVCIPGKLAYYEGEAPRNRYILDRKVRHSLRQGQALARLASGDPTSERTPT